MSGPIQLIPPGLLDFFSLKSLGVNPGSLIESYQPTIDMLDWAMEAKALDSRFEFGGIASLSLAAASSSGAFNFNVNNPVVPQNEIWRVLQMTVQVSLVAAEFSSLAPCFLTPGGGTTAPYLVGQVADRYAGTAAGVLNVCFADDPFWLPPGSQLGVFVREQVCAVNLNYQAFWRFVRCRR
jgi:hypothetical protein